SLLGYYISAVIIGIGYGCCSTIPVCLLIAAWFRKRRGTAVGIAYAGSGMAAILFSPVLMSITVNYGLAKAFLFQSICIAVLTFATFLLIRNGPADKGITPYGQNETEKQIDEKNESIQSDIVFTEDFLTRRHYIMLLAIITLGAAVQPVVTHFPTFMISVGYEPHFTASLVSIYGFTMVLGKTMYGLVIDRLGGYGANFIIFPLWLLTIALSFVAGKGVTAAYLFAALLGMGPALATVSLPIWTGDLFRKESFAAILTSIQITLNLGSSIGVVLMGLLFDLTGEYRVSFSLTFLFVMITFICMQGLYRTNAVNEKK
ncbi:MAG TPA: MFS transporter, partial [Patescibacteria group bacterium]|nr:MFS transporter [Patescibacteria group bacterium]